MAKADNVPALIVASTLIPARILRSLFGRSISTSKVRVAGLDFAAILDTVAVREPLPAISTVTLVPIFICATSFWGTATTTESLSSPRIVAIAVSRRTRSPFSTCNISR